MSNDWEVESSVSNESWEVDNSWEVESEDKGGMAKAFGAGVDKVQELGYRAVKGFTDVGNEGDGLIEQDGPLAKFAQEGIDTNIEEQKAYEPTVPSYKDVDSIGSAASYAGELVAGSVPYMAAAMTGVGAAGMAGGLSQEAYDKQEDKNAARAVASGVGQMALERLGIKGSLGQIGKDVMKDGVMATAKRYNKGEFAEVMKSPQGALEFSKRIVKGSLWEGTTEAGQEALAQWGAGKDVAEISGLDEAFVGGFVVGGVIRTSSEGAQRVMQWQQKSAPVVKSGIEELVKQGVTQEEAIEQVRKQSIESAMKQGLSEAEAVASAARTLKTEYGIEHELFTPIANDVASRRAAMNERLNQQRIDGGIGVLQQNLSGDRAPTADELVQQQMQANAPEFFDQLDQVDQQNTSTVNKVTETEKDLPLPENTSVSEKYLQTDAVEAPQKVKFNGLSIVEAPVNELSLSSDVPQFKAGSNDKGVVEPLGGKFDRTGVAPIQVWVRSNGDKEVVSGRHRLDLAARSGESTIPAQYHYEDSGFNKTQAASLDAILNVREGQGKVKDYVEFIKQSELSEKEADANGILARATGKRAYAIANLGSDSLITAHRNDGITDEGAVRIAKAAPNNETLQAVGIKAINDGKSIAVAENLVKAVKSMTNEQQQTSGDLFGFDDSAMIEAEELAKKASAKQSEIQRTLSAVQGAAKRPELAAKEGVNVKDPKAVNQRIAQLKEEKRAWDNWHTNPELVAQLTGPKKVEPIPDVTEDITPDNQDSLFGEPEPIAEKAPETTASQEAVLVSEHKTIDQAAHEAATSPKNDLPEPTIAQAEANNYKLGRIEHSGMKIGIENPEGSYRKGVDSDGKEWSNKINHHYGDLTGTKGADGDALDVFVKPGTVDGEKVFVVDQVNPSDGKFDEHKVMMGFSSKEEAEAAYRSNYTKDWQGLGNITEASQDNFKSWLKDSDTTKPFAEKVEVIAPVSSLYADGMERVTHTVRKSGKELMGVVDNNLTRDEAKAIDPSTFRKGKDGWFIRENRIEEYNQSNEAIVKPEAVKDDTAVKPVSTKTTAEESANKKPKKNFSWDAVELSKNYTAKELNDWITELTKDPDNKNNGGGIELYDKKTMKKIDKLGWAVTYLIQQKREGSDTSIVADEVAMQAPVPPKENNLLPGAEKAPKPKIEKIDDFGETLHGANKHNYTYNEQLSEDIDVAAVPLSKSFPQPDYEKLATEGADPRALAFIAQLRGEIKTKPRQKNKVGRWSEQVETARKYANKLLEMGKDGPEALIESLKKEGGSRGGYLKHLPLLLDIANDIPAKNIKALGNYKLEQTLYMIFKGEKNVNKWVVTDTEAKGGFGGMGNMTHFDTSEEAVAYIKSQVTDEVITNGKKLAKFDVWTERGKPGIIFVGKKLAARKYVELKQFSNTKEAREYINSNNEALVAALKEKKKIKAHRRPDNNPRIGADHRKGVNATPEMFDEAFGFRGVQFGNWVEGHKRQTDLNYAYDGLMDLASILDLPSKALSLNGDLGLAFGARGKGGSGAVAHYEPSTVVINLTKKMGAGSLAHEWWHALDNYFSKMDSTKLGAITKDFITEGGRKSGVNKDGKFQRAKPEDFGVREEVFNAFQSLTKAINSETKLAERSAELDKLRTKDYWGTVIEMTARSFERYVIDKLASQGFESDYLANIIPESSVEASKEISDYPYPLAVEMDVVNKAYDAIFDILETKETDKGTALFSRATLNDEIATDSNSVTVSELETNKVIEQVVSIDGSLLGKDHFVVASTFDKLPKAIKDAAKDQDAENGIGGVYYQGKTYLVRDKLANAKEVEETIFHETYGHYGIRKLFGKELPKKLNQLLQGIGGIAGLDKIAKKHNIDLSDYKKGLAQSSLTNAQAQTILMDELLAHLAQENRPSIKRLVKEVIGAIRQGLKRMGYKRLKGITDSELFYILKQARAAAHQADGNTNSDILFSRVSDAISAVTPKKQSDTLIANEDEGRVNKKIRQLQDKFKPLKTVQEIISKTKKIAHDANAYIAEELFHGKVEDDLRKMERDYVQPLVDSLVEHKINMAELDLYVIAKHAKERNIDISNKNDAFDGTNGSGMTNDEAQIILDKAVFEEKRLGLEDAANKIYAMTEAKRKLLSESGLLSDSELASWDSKFKFYVPLKGFANDEVDSNNQPIPRIGKGFAIQGRESMRALGRRTMAASPATQVIQDLTESVIRHRKNEVGNAFLKLVKSNPDADYWQVFTDEDPDTDRRFDKASDKVIEAKIPMAMASDKYFTTKVNGETQYIKIKDDRLMMAMKNLGVDKVGSVVQVLGKINRYLSTINTSFNPEFMISNMARDVQTAVFNVQAEQDLPQGKIKGKNIATAMVKDWIHARKGIALSLANKEVARDGNGKPKGKAAEYQELFDQFREDGAKTGYFDMKDMDQQVNDINTMLEMAKNTNKGKAIRFAKKVGDLVENVNQSVENAVRLSAYKQALDAFGDVNDKANRQKAASLAKNLTVNFNRKGEVGTTMNALYMFANASVQGSAQFLRSMQGYRDTEGKYKFTGAQKTAAIFATGAFALAAVNRAFSDDDDDEVSFWDKIPSHIKERNIVIMKSVFGFGEPGDYISIPLPYGYNVFSVFGTAAEAAIYGNKTAAQSAGSVVGAVIGSFSPIGSQDSDNVFKGLAKTLAPTIMQPIVQLGVNENFYGGSIYQENFQFGTQKPDSAMSKRNTADGYKALSSWLNEATGGSYYRSGLVDISPEVFKYFVDFGTGAAGTFAVRTGTAVGKVAKGESFDDREVPFYRKVSGQTNDNWADQDRFYDRGNTIKQTLDEYKSLRGSDRINFRQENQGKLSMANRVKVTEKQLIALRKRYKAIESSSSYAAAEKTKMLDMNKVQQDKLVDKFNLKYNELNK